MLSINTNILILINWEKDTFTCLGSSWIGLWNSRPSLVLWYLFLFWNLATTTQNRWGHETYMTRVCTLCLLQAWMRYQSYLYFNTRFAVMFIYKLTFVLPVLVAVLPLSADPFPPLFLFKFFVLSCAVAPAFAWRADDLVTRFSGFASNFPGSISAVGFFAFLLVVLSVVKNGAGL